MDGCQKNRSPVPSASGCHSQPWAFAYYSPVKKYKSVLDYYFNDVNAFIFFYGGSIFLGPGDGAPTMMVVSSRIKVLLLQSGLMTLGVALLRSPRVLAPPPPSFSWLTGWLSVLSVGVVPCASAGTTLSSLTTYLFKALEAKSSAWSSAIIMFVCLGRSDSLADMLGAIANLHLTQWSTIAVIQRGLFLYIGLYRYFNGWISRCSFFLTRCCSLYVWAMVVQRL